jgi:hypothetical protein
VDVTLAIVLVLSAVVTLYIWWRIAQSSDPLPFKVFLGIAVAIPIIGPLFWPFLSMPPRHNLDGPFKGPRAPLPAHPLWLSVSVRVIVVLLALGAVAVHFLIVREVAK